MTRSKTPPKASRRASGVSGMPVASTSPERSHKTFAAELRHVIAVAAALDPVTDAGAASSEPLANTATPRVAKVATPISANVMQLQSVLSGLQAESALKLCALLLAGRDGRDIGTVDTVSLATEANSWFSVHALGNKGAKLAEYLRRGHAIACATAFDLEAPIAQWPLATAQSLEDRVWLSFGRQLALSAPGEWKSLGVGAGPGPQQVSKLYLQLADKAWWSFRWVLDRPSPAVMLRAQRADKSAHPDVADDSLRNVAALAIAGEGRALRRALRAIRARMGVGAEATAGGQPL